MARKTIRRIKRWAMPGPVRAGVSLGVRRSSAAVSVKLPCSKRRTVVKRRLW